MRAIKMDLTFYCILFYEVSGYNFKMVFLSQRKTGISADRWLSM